MRQAPALLFLLALAFALGGAAGYVLGSGGEVAASELDRSMEGSSRPERFGDEQTGSKGAELLALSPEGGDRQVAPLSGRSAAALAQSVGRALEPLAEPDSFSIQSHGLSGIGSVVNSRGEPVPGAQVVFEHRRGRQGPVEGRGTEGVGRPWGGPGDAKEELLQLAQDLVQRRGDVRSAATGDDGRFEVTGLSPGQYAVSAFAEGLAFDRELCSAGTPLRLIGRPVGEFHLDVRLASGEAPERAIIHILGDPLRTRTALWTPAEPVVRYSAQGATMMALVGETLQIGSGQYVAPLASERRAVDLLREGEGPHVFDVRPVGQIQVTVEDLSGKTPAIEPWVSVRRVKGAEPARRLRQYRGGPFVLFPAEPGTYEITAGRGSKVPEVTRTVQVTGGTAPVAIELGEVDRSRYLTVRCHTASGDPVDDVRFRYQLPKVGGGRSGSAGSVARGLGEYWIELDQLVKTDQDLDGAELFLAVESGRYGYAVQSGSMPLEEMRFVFEEPSELKVQLSGMGDRSWRVAVDSAPEGEPENAMPQRSTQRYDVPSSGLVRIGSKQPGKIVIRAFPVGTDRWAPAVATVEETCFSGDCTVTVSLPKVEGLELFAPTFAKGTRCYMSRLDDPTDRPASYQSKLRRGQRATFGDVPPGRYSLVLWEDSRAEMMELEIPTPNVTFQPEPLLGFEVLGVTPGGVGAGAGVEVGDRLIAINEHSADDHQWMTRVHLAIGLGPSKLVVRRGGADVELDLPQSNDGMGVRARPRSR